MIVDVLLGWVALSLIAIPVALAFCRAAARGDRQVRATAAATRQIVSCESDIIYAWSIPRP